MDEISITVNLADRPYKLIIKRDEEEVFREAAKIINDRLKSYSTNYAFKDRQDLLAMVALQYTTNALKNEKVIAFRDTELISRLQQLDNTLDKELARD